MMPLSVTPEAGEFLILGKAAHRNIGPYLSASDDGRAMLEAHVKSGYAYRTGPHHYAPTWLGWLTQRPKLFDLLTVRN